MRRSGVRIPSAPLRTLPRLQTTPAEETPGSSDRSVIEVPDQEAAVASAAKASKALRTRIEVRAVQEAPTGEGA